jgi:hypothetical protein
MFLKVFGVKMGGRPKRDPAVLSELLRHEFWWTVVFAQMRYGKPGGDLGTPDPIKARRWRYIRSGKFWLDTKTGRRVSGWDWDAYAEEIEADFTESVVLALPRDLPAEPDVWSRLAALDAQPAEVRRVAGMSQYLSPSHRQVLVRYAAQFCESKRDERYPCAGLKKGSKPRPSSQDKRAEYLARVMAGLSLCEPMAPATAVDLLRKWKHGKRCPCLFCRVFPGGQVKVADSEQWHRVKTPS